MNENIDLIKGLLKSQVEKYGDLLVNLYSKVKRGGALSTTTDERTALYKLADKYQSIRGTIEVTNTKNKVPKINKKNLPEINFTDLVNGIKQHIIIKQMTQWGGHYNPHVSPINNDVTYKSRKVSRRLYPLYHEYITYKSSQLSTSNSD